MDAHTQQSQQSQQRAGRLPRQTGGPPPVTRIGVLATSTIPAGAGPAAVAVTPGGKAYVVNTDSDSVTVIDTATGTVLDTIALPAGSGPTAAAVAGGKVYVTNLNTDTVSVISTATDTVTGTVTLPAGTGPIGVAVSNGKAYVSNFLAGSVTVVDTATDTIVPVVSPIPAGLLPSGAGSSNGLVFVANTGSHTVTVIDSSTDTTQTIALPAGSGPSSVAVSGGFAHVVNSGSATVSVIDTATLLVTDTIVLPPGTEPVAVAIADDGRAYVTDYAGDVALVIDTATHAILYTVAAGTTPYGIAVAPGGDIYVTNYTVGEVTVLTVPVVTGVTPTTGPSTGGTAVTITGSGFTGATDVTIAGVPAASVTVNSDTGITAVTAPGTGSGPVIVTTAEGTGTSAGTFTYVFSPTSTTTTLEVIPGPAVCGEDVTLRATVLTANGDPVTTGSVTFILSDGGPVRTVALDASGQASTVYSGLGVGVRQAAAFFVPADPGTAASNSPLTPVTVEPVTTTTTVTAVPAATTQGQPVTLTATVIPSSSGPETIDGTVTFTGPGGFSQTVPVDPGGVATATTSALPAGTNTVTAAYNGNGCFAGSSGTVTVTVTPPATTATRLDAEPAAIRMRTNGTFVIPALRATLTDAATGAPLPGQTVTFTADPTTGQVTLGTAVTNASGVATLSTVTVQSTLVTTESYRASFAGTAVHGPSTDTAPLDFRPLPLLP
ncbi:Ig-like domain repeat protein [Streptomyces xinghaiensis]|uniref:Ig-like domain repeat protein n=1 Tax=Streptomyces xinghaiensis TaxID=1038928 RepID=UPI0006864EA2|nr:Ig-like domain repeat protein [Streptomyces xinghaiensis]MZE79601.1 hypothetical protein [Streptomyces sp. SID5475]